MAKGFRVGIKAANAKNNMLLQLELEFFSGEGASSLSRPLLPVVFDAITATNLYSYCTVILNNIWL